MGQWPWRPKAHASWPVTAEGYFMQGYETLGMLVSVAEAESEINRW